MRFKLNGPQLHLAGCTLFTWFVTACVGDVMPTSSVPYEVVKEQRMMKTGMAVGKVTDGQGRVLFDSTFNARDFAIQAAAHRARTMTHDDSLSVQVLGALLMGKTRNPAQTGPVHVRLGGRDISLNVSSRNARGDAQDFSLSIGNGDTSIVVKAPSLLSTTRSVEVKARGQLLLSASNTLETMPVNAAQTVPPDAGWCGEQFEVAMAEIAAGVIAIIDGLGQLSMLECVSGVVLIGSASGELYMWFEDCSNLMNNWLYDLWTSACSSPIWSWAPVCE